MIRFRGLFTRINTRKALPQTRTLYTDQIYPYPEKYANTVRYPSQACYRETWKRVPWADHDDRYGFLINTLMWTILTIFALEDGKNLLGHFDIPDPSIWTDEELGIPPDDE